MALCLVTFMLLNKETRFAPLFPGEFNSNDGQFCPRIISDERAELNSLKIYILLNMFPTEIILCLRIKFGKSTIQ